MIKIGDNVRFLNDIGGGIVVKTDEMKGLVYVEDSDGFEVPVLEREVVVVPKVNENTNFPIRDFSSTKKIKNEETAEEKMIEKTVERVEEPIFETADGDNLNVLLAFFPIDIKNLQTTAYECYLVNDSNYFLYYNIVIGEEGHKSSLTNGLIEPNTQELLHEISKDELNKWEKTRVQIIPFKKEKEYIPQNIIDADLKLNTVKFYKLHSFEDNDYFDDPAMIVDLKTITEKKQQSEISPERIQEAIFRKEEKKQKRNRIPSNKKGSNIIEIDLHINELLDSTNGLSNADILNFQLDKFNEILEANKKNKGQKIVFVHGKGDGVLRKEIEKQLKTKYKSYYFQDASFREYGFGATMVTIR